MQKNRIKTKLALVVFATAMMSSKVMAAEPPIIPLTAYEDGIVPYWDDTANVTVTISANGNMLSSIAIVETDGSTAKSSGTMYLEKYSSGCWVRVKSWSIKGTGSYTVKKTCKGVLDTEYRVRVTLKSGNDKIEETSDSYYL